MKKVYICLGVMVLFIVAAVLIKKPADDAKLDYKEVKARVVSSEAKQKRIKTKYSTTYQTVYEVVVSYNGKEYDLKNAHNSYSYRKGSEVTVYLAYGKLYANIEGVRNASPLGIAHSVAIFGAFAMFILSMLLLAKVGQKNRPA
ncbi:MAG: penicillin-binding protein [Lachnospiraceae bacterium]|nr:penicillin-binding protein [Lachnospiraceae bacterium]